MKTIWILFVLSLATAANPARLAAQSSERDDDHLRNDCRLAAQVILTGHPASHRAWAWRVISRCDVVGEQTLISAWQRALPADDGGLGALASATRRYPTRRVFDAVAGVAENPEARVNARLTSISLLQSFVVSSLGFASRDLLSPPTGRLWIVVGTSHHDQRDDTSEVLQAKDEVIAILLRIREQPSDPMVRNAVEQHLRLLEY